jgi:hypothetical protein
MAPHVIDPIDEKTKSYTGSLDKDTEAFAAKGETEEIHHVTLHDADEAAAFVSGFRGEIDPAEAHRVLRKIDWHLLPLM